MKRKPLLCLALALGGHWFGISPIARCILIMAPASLRVVGLLSACTALLTGIAHGQPGPLYPRLCESIEAKVGQAGTVFLGRITNFTRTVLVPRDGRNPNGKVRYTVEVRVEEVLKGMPPQPAEFSEETAGFDERIEHWREERTSFLWFIGGTQTVRSYTSQGRSESYTNMPVGGWRHLRLGEAVPREEWFGAQDPIFSMDFTCLTNADEILSRARQFSQEHSGPLKTHVFEAPPVKGCELPRYFWMALAVPILPSLETTARRFIRSPEDFLVETPEWARTNAAMKADWLKSTFCMQGIKALRYFKSAENIELIKPFLTDPMATDMEVASGERIGKIDRHYPMRALAYEVLRSWDFAVPEPVLEEPLPEPESKPSLGVWTDSNSPVSIAMDRQGNVYVSDQGNSLVRKLTPVGTNWVVNAVAGTDGGHPDWRSEGRECSIALDALGNVYLADSYRCIIQRLTPLGTNWVATTLAGRLGYRGGEDGTNGAARFDEPSAIAVDNHGNVYVAQTRDPALRLLTPSGTNWVVTTIVPEPNKDESAAHAERLWRPTGLAVDSAGNVYVADQGNKRIFKLTRSGSKWTMTTVAGSGTPGDTYAEGMRGTARFASPNAVALDPSGILYIADGINDVATIREIVLAEPGGVVTTIAGVARFEPRQARTPFADGPASEARFTYPRGLAMDSAGNIYVADTWNGAVRKLTPEGAAWRVTTIAGHDAPVREALTR